MAKQKVESKPATQNEKLTAVAEQAAANLKALIAEGQAEILKSWDGVVEEAQAQDVKPKLKLGFSITLDLDKDGASYDLVFGVRHKLSSCAPIPDPNQMEMEVVE